MRYRKLDASGDYSFGQGQDNIWVDVPEAPAQAVQTRLNLWEGQWFLDTREGMPWKTEVLGNRTANTRDPAVRQRALGSMGVRGILQYSSNLDRETRAFSVSMIIDTVYGVSQPIGVNYQ